MIWRLRMSINNLSRYLIQLTKDSLYLPCHAIFSNITTAIVLDTLHFMLCTYMCMYIGYLYCWNLFQNVWIYKKITMFTFGYFPNYFISECTSGKVVVRCRRITLISLESSSFIPLTTLPALLNSACMSSPPCSLSRPKPIPNLGSCSTAWSSRRWSFGVMLACKIYEVNFSKMVTGKFKFSVRNMIHVLNIHVPSKFAHLVPCQMTVSHHG